MNKSYSNGEKFKHKTLPKTKDIVGRSFPITLHEHKADKAGLHYDLRLGGKGDWAIRYFPKAPGEKRLAIRQPTHPLDYYDFEGDIKSGYGKGSVKLLHSGDGKINKWSSKRINFSLKDNSNYSLINTDNDRWLIMKHEKNSSYLRQGDDSRLRRALAFESFGEALREMGVSSQDPCLTSSSPPPAPAGSGETMSHKFRAINPQDNEDWNPLRGTSLRGSREMYLGDLGV